MKPVTIAVVTAGLSQPSSTRLLADRLSSATVRQVAEAGGQAEVTVTELRDLAHDITDALLTGFAGPAVAEVIGLVTRADALIAVTPLSTGRQASQDGQDQPAGAGRRCGDPFASFTPFEDLLRGA